MAKWGDRPHYEFEAVYLGSDEHGDWCGVAGGTLFTRPGVEWHAPVDQVMLVPAPAAGERHWIATFHAPGGPVEVYVDMTTPPEWDGAVLRAVDLDLDVVRGVTGRVWVDDEDEFAEHRVALEYPEEVVAAAIAVASAGAGHVDGGCAVRRSTPCLARRSDRTACLRLDRRGLAGRAAAGRPGGDRRAGSRAGSPPA